MPRNDDGGDAGRDAQQDDRKRKIIRVVIGVAVAIILLGALDVLVVGYVAADTLLHPEREKISDNPWDHNMTAENITLTTSDGIEISAWFIPSEGGENSTATIILAHGYTRCRSQMMPYAVFLHRAGYNILMFDFRAHGESGGDICTIGYHEPREVIAALDYIESRPGLDIYRTGALGLSMGAASVVRAAGVDHRLKAVVSDSSFSTGDRVAVRAFTYFSGYPEKPYGPVAVWMMERQLHHSASDIDVPARAAKMDNSQHLLIIQGDADSIAGEYDAHKIYDSAGCQDKELWIIPGTPHVKGHEEHPEEYEERVLAFFDRTL